MGTKLRKTSPIVAALIAAYNSMRLQFATMLGTPVVNVRHVRYENVPAADLTSVVAALDPVANGALTIAAQPKFPCKLQVRLVDANGSISAGTVTLVGVGVNGQAVTQTIALTGGTATTTTTDVYATLTSATVASIAGAAAGDTIGIGPSSALGLPAVVGFTSLSVFKSCANETNEAVGTVDATAGSIVPTTAPDGTVDFDFWYKFSVTPAGVKFHLDTSDSTVTAAAASDLATSLTLVNELAAVFYGPPTGANATSIFPGHALDALAHVAADSTNGALTAARPATTLAEAITLANELKADYNAHLTQSGVHLNNDSTNSIAASNASDQSSLNTLVNELRTDMAAHIASAVAGYSLRGIDP